MKNLQKNVTKMNKEPYYKLVSVGSLFTPKHNFRIMTYNVEGFKDYDGVLKVISDSDADIIGLNEALFFNNILREKFTNDAISMGYNIKMVNTYGINVILSKHHISSSKVIKLAKDPVKNRNRYALHVNICSTDIILTHLDAFDQSGKTRFKQIIEIGSYIKNNFILMGDFNSDFDSDVVKAVRTCFTDSFSLVGKEQPVFTCWNGKTIDFIFIGNHSNIKLKDSNVYNSTASDHSAIYVDI